MENFIKNLARGAGKILKDGFRTKFKINHKSALWDVVTEFDLASEKFIIDRIRKKFPSHGILSEESGQIGSRKNFWLIDPLDGTLAFVRGVAHLFGVAIAYIASGQIQMSAIYAPMDDELYFAKKSGGAYLNGKIINIFHPNGLRFSNISMFLGTQFTTDRQKKFIYEKLVIKHQLWRVGGAGASISAAYTACGRFDTYLAINLPAWDNAPGALLMQAAGAKVTDFKGRAFRWNSPFLVASAPNIHGEIIKVLKKV